MEIGQVLTPLLLAAQALVALPVGYFCLLAGAAFVASWRARRAGATPLAGSGRATRFAILIPAHDEETLIGQILASLAAQDYPRDRYQVIVIADNCADTTAERARAAEGVWVYERHDSTSRGKGQALRWAFERLEREGHVFDAYIIFDADSVVEPDVLAALARHIARGARAMQIRYGVLNADEAPSAALRWFALTLMNHVRPYGRYTLGGSSTLLGNGMCFTRELLERHPWRANALSEDYQYYLTLVQAGERVVYVPEAVVRAHMPTSFGQLKTQDIRWESPQPENDEWRIAWRLLRDGLRQRNVVFLEAFAELAAPPTSPQVAFYALTLVMALALHAPAPLWAAGILGGVLLAYLASAFILARPPRMLFKAIFYIPGFVIWKLWVVLVLKRSKKHTSEWVRTSRPDAAPVPRA